MYFALAYWLKKLYGSDHRLLALLISIFPLFSFRMPLVAPPTVAFLASSPTSRAVPSATGLGASALAQIFLSLALRATILEVPSPPKFWPSVSLEISLWKAAEHLAPSRRSGAQESGMEKVFKFWILTRIGFLVHLVTISSTLTLSRYWISTKIAWREH